MRLLFFFLSLATTALAQTVVIEAYPGCFGGPRPHTITLSSDSSPVLHYKGKEPIPVGTVQQAQVAIRRLQALELSVEELQLLRKLSNGEGPARYSIRVTLADRVWSVPYRADLIGLTPEEKRLAAYDGPTLAMIEKLDKIHAIVAEFSPKEGK